MDTMTINQYQTAHRRRLCSRLQAMPSLQELNLRLPKAEELKEKPVIAKVDVPQVKPELSSRAKAIAEINENHLDDIIKQLKDYAPLTKSEDVKCSSYNRTCL